jgi:hypothetical protein
VCALAETYAALCSLPTARARAAAAIQRLADAVGLYGQVRQAGVAVKDNADAYQENWRLAIADVLSSRSSDYDFLELL